MTILRFAKQLPENKRVQIIIAIRRIIERFQNGETHTSINMPPRVGKSSIIRLAALELNAITKMPTIMTAPWTDNVDQILEAEKIETTYRNYGVDLATPFLTHRVKHLPTNRWWMLTAGMPTLVSCTVGLINNQANRQQFLDGIQDIYQRSNGKRVPVFVDECHLFKDVKAWGIFLREVVDCGGYIVLLTGTAVPGVPGFIEQFTEWEEVRNKTHRKTFVDGEVKHFLDTKEGETRYLESLTADFEMKWQEAWDIGALAKANAVWIDMNVIDENNKEPLGKLSELTTSELNGRLRKVMESQELMKLQIDRGLHRLMQLKSKNNTKNAQMIIVTGSDIDLEDRKESNRHARACEKELKRAAEAIGHVLRIVIATGSIEKAADIIKEFRKGYHDVLIVKFMGLVGLDVPSCKVGIFASPLRNGPLAIQALSRTLTNWVCPATWILPKDRKMVDLYNRVITDQGGEYHESKLRLVESIEVEPPDERPTWEFEGAVIDSYSDQSGKNESGDFEAVLELVKLRYHTNGLTDLQIIENIKLGGFPVSDSERSANLTEKRQLKESGIKDLDEDLRNMEGKFGLTANEIVTKHVGAFYRGNKIWVDKVIELKRIAKELCGVRQAVNDIDDAELLKRLVAALGPAEQKLFGHDKAQHV